MLSPSDAHLETSELYTEKKKRCIPILNYKLWDLTGLETLPFSFTRVRFRCALLSCLDGILLWLCLLLFVTPRS